jgi:hypothetical protein
MGKVQIPDLALVITVKINSDTSVWVLLLKIIKVVKKWEFFLIFAEIDCEKCGAFGDGELCVALRRSGDDGR